MYISEVIERAKALHPTEYTVQEYINWCDELSSDIRRNYDIRYAKLKENTTNVILPDDVSINEISKVIMDGKELKKTDLRDFGLEYEYSVDGRVVKKTDGEPAEFEIIYQVPHTPIRCVDGDYYLSFGEYCFLSPDVPLVPGDNVTFTVDGTEYKGTILTKDEYLFTYTGDRVPAYSTDAHVFRNFADKTLLPAPYDSAYIDFVNAKASLYQGDRDAYETFMTQFNSKFNDWKQYLTRNKPRIERKWTNWF